MMPEFDGDVMRIGWIIIGRWSRYSRPLTYRLTCGSNPQHNLLRSIFGYTDNVDWVHREAVVDDFGDLVLLHWRTGYHPIFSFISQEH